ncbi:MAG: DUF4111 domain-containing protein [Anaerolineae bacterium]|nr:DUF4111 domain-containing protein [Anaerolineae bacterium]
MTFMPSPVPELNAVLFDLAASAEAILGFNFVGAYMQGSLALGDFDMYSDVDFLVVVEHDLNAVEWAALQAMHQRLYDVDTPLAKHLEGSYIPADVMRSVDPTRAGFAYLDNGAREFIRSNHDNTAVVRWVLRNHGIPLSGPPPHTLIDPVDPDDLRRETYAILRGWCDQILLQPDEMNTHWYQSFMTLTLCRMAYTLQNAAVVSKPGAARWAQAALNPAWRALIQRAADQRPYLATRMGQPADPQDFTRTLDFIRYILDWSQPYAQNTQV